MSHLPRLAAALVLFLAVAAKAEVAIPLHDTTRAASLRSIDESAAASKQIAIDQLLGRMDDSIKAVRNVRPLWGAGMIGGTVIATIGYIAFDQAVNPQPGSKSSGSAAPGLAGFFGGLGLATVCGIQFGTAGSRISALEWRQQRIRDGKLPL